MNEKKGMAFLYASLGPLVLKQLAGDSSVTAALGAEVAEIVRTLNPPLPSGEREGVRGIPSSQPSPLEVRGEGERAVMTAVLDKIYPVQSNKPRNPQIAGWLIKQVLEHKHNDKPVMAEDFYKIGEDFTYFESLKKSNVGIKTDLLRYANLAELRNALEPFAQKKKQKESEELERHLPKEQRDKLMGETTVLYSGPEGKVVIPHTPESSIYWGNNTKWCIAGTEYAHTHFPRYNEKSPVIMILPAGKENDKVALVDRILYDSADEQISALPSEHQALMNKTLKKLSLSARSGLEAWLPKSPETAPPNPVPVQPRVQEEIRQTRRTGRAFRPELWANKNFVLEAVRHDGWALKYAAPELQADPAIVRDAVRQDGRALGYAAPALKADPAIVLEAVRQYGGALEDAAPALQADPAIVLEAVRQDGGALYHAASELKADPAIVTEAVRQNGWALDYVAWTLKGDKEFVRDCLEKTDDLPFVIKALEVIDPNVFRPEDKDLDIYQLKALERLVAKRDMKVFSKHARHFKAVWGDAEALLGGDPQKALDKIKADYVRRYPSAKTKFSTALRA